MTEVRHVNDPRGYDLYIGRASPRRGLRASIWGNPFKVTLQRSVEQAVAQYREYLLGRPELLAQLPELRGKALACWCKPALPCHGDVLVELAETARPGAGTSSKGV